GVNQYPWAGSMDSINLFNHGVDIGGEGDFFRVNDVAAVPGQPPQSNFRLGEIQELQHRGDIWGQVTGAIIPPGGGIEARWAFLGLSHRMAGFGPAWTCFYYGLSDIYVGGHATGS